MKQMFISGVCLLLHLDWDGWMDAGKEWTEGENKSKSNINTGQMVKCSQCVIQSILKYIVYYEQKHPTCRSWHLKHLH